MARTRLAIVTTHPIQHFVPFYRAIADDPGIALRVFFGAPIGIKSYFDHEMQTEISWAMDMLGGYDHVMLSPDQGDVQTRFTRPNSPETSAALSAFAPDAVLIYGYAQINAWRALLWCKRHGVPALMIGDSELVQKRSRWKRAARSLIIARILRRVSAFLAVGDNNEAFYRAFGAKASQIFRVPFTIDEISYRAAQTDRAALRAAVRAEHGIGPDDFVALFVGKLSARKRPDDLAEAVALCRRDRPDLPIHALFAGNGERMPALEGRAQTEPWLHLGGFVNVNRLPAYYAAADMLVHPSEADPHPLICSEAACMGLPMMLSDRVGALGPSDVAREGENALSFRVTDTHAIATMLIDLAGDRAEYARMAARSLAIFDEVDVKASLRGLNDALAFVQGR